MRTTTHRMPNRFCATWPITMFVLSPSVATTTASASSMPGLAQDVGVHAVPDDEPAGPVVAEPAERLLVLVDGGHVPPFAVELEREVEPTRPQPITIAFTVSA